MRPESAPPARRVRMRVGSALHQGGRRATTEMSWRRSVSVISAAAAGYDSGVVPSGTWTSWRPRSAEPTRRTGTVTRRTRNARASPAVMGKPRRTLRKRPGRVPPFSAGGGRHPAPIATGTNRASAIHTRRTSHAGRASGRGTKARKKAAALGATTPARSSGQAAADATSPESSIRRRPLTRPKSATTAQSNSAVRIFPTDRLMRLRTAWISAMRRPSGLAPSSRVPAPLAAWSAERPELRQDLVGVELEEALLLLTHLVHADVVVARVRVLADGGQMPRGIRAARDGLCDLRLGDQLRHRLEVGGQRQLPGKAAFHGGRGPVLSRDAASGRL